MRKLLLVILLSLLSFAEGRAQKPVQKIKTEFLHPLSKTLDYNKLLPDTADMIHQSGHYIDSVKQAKFSSNKDTDRVWQLLLRAQMHLFSDPDSSIYFAQEGLDLSNKIKFEPGIYNLTHWLGVVHFFKGNYTSGLPIFFKQLKKANGENNGYRQAWALQTVAIIYLSTEDPTTAVNYFRQAIEKINPYTNIYPLSAEVILGNAAMSFIALNKLDTALVLLKRAYDIDTLVHRYWSHPARQMAFIYSQKGEYTTALNYYRQSFHYAKNLLPLPYDTIAALNGMATVFAKKAQYDSALYFAKSALTSAATFPPLLLQTYAVLTDIYQSKNQLDSAFRYQQKQIQLGNTIAGQDKLKQIQNIGFNEQMQQQELEAAQVRYQNRMRVYILSGVIAIVLVIVFLLWRNNSQRQRAYALLQMQKEKTDLTLQALRTTQAQLIQSEKLASLGQLTTGIAHEIQNPLNFINNFSDVNRELLDELKQEAKAGNSAEIIELAEMVIGNEEKINHHGKRADAIVKGMLQHSRSSSGVKEPINVNALTDEYLRLSHHGMQANDKSFQTRLQTRFDDSIGMIEAVPQDIGQVLVNLLNNAFYAVAEKRKHQGNGYEPAIVVTTKNLRGNVEISVQDNGNGIPKNLVDKIFQPFFTTKPTGQGTGLGLSLSYDIVKAHNGEVRVNSKEGEGTEIIVSLPV